MRAPDFWWRRETSWASRLLAPASVLYAAIANNRMRLRGEMTALPVVCIGNFTAGGAGKTPTAMVSAALLASSGEIPVFLSRGYGGSLTGPVQVEPWHTARDIGDEPRLLADIAPAIVSRNRAAGARLALEIGATVIVMDDGLQNPTILKDCVIAVVDGATGIGNGRVIPSGPLRASLAVQFNHVDAILIVGDGAAGDAVARDARQRGKKVFSARLVPDETHLAALRAAPVLAFAGIGRPEKFFQTLRDAGVIVAATRSFPDHHVFTAGDVEALQGQAATQHLTPVTTEKDLARLQGIDHLPAWPDLCALRVRLQITDEENFRHLLLRRIAERRTRAGSG